MKFVVALALLATCAMATAHQISNKNLITDIIAGIIKNNLPKLANLNIPSINLGEKGTITNLTLTNLENLVIERLDSAGPLSVDIKNLTVTLVTASATAQIAINDIEIQEIGLVVNGAGDLSGSADLLRLTVALDLSLDGLKPVLEDFTNLEIRVENISAALTGIDNADATNEIINTRLAGFLTANLATIANENKPAIIEIINTILSSILQ